ncbi:MULTISPECIES: TolC family protein [Aquimarina]|uniref:TolC family protein n=1 Tax=Aquimarina algiphila TaxID=2047982 RepID=A0A554VDS4_9FLAO|nr:MULTISPECIES: TolC family protein [Aquimarina]TSE05060.1 TolC family protein [Aquimarina algiphila]
MRNYLLYSLLFLVSSLFSQEIETDTIVLNFKEYLGYVKKYHPITKQAELNIDIGQANLMKARGGFDPKMEVDYDRKKFKGTEYYDLLNATFKIPTWYGIEFKGGFEQNDGDFLNPQNSVPDDGLFSAGVSIPIARGLLINDRMATLRKAKFFREQTKANRDLLVNQILYDASLAYFDWLRAYAEKEIYNDFVQNAKIRFEGVKRSALAGDKAAIDTTEAKIAFQNRTLSLEQAKVKLMKSSLALSNFLWLEGNVPIELQSNVIPDQKVEEVIDSTLEIEGSPLSSFTLENHPKLKSLAYKIEGLEVDRKLKANKLLPKIDLEYNFLTETPETARSFNTAEYKGGVSFSFPLFLRKERGALKLAKYKVQDARFELETTQLQIKNKVTAIFAELESFINQNELIENIVRDYNTLLAAEERKFSFGESSLFLINSREKSLIDAKLKEIEVQNKFFTTKAKLFNSLAVNPLSL